MSAYRIEGISEGIVLHPNLETIKAFVIMQNALEYQFTREQNDKSLVLEGCLERIPRKRSLRYLAEDLGLLLKLVKNGTNPLEAFRISQQAGKDKAKIQALVLRWDEEVETSTKGQRHYMSNGIALAVNNRVDQGVDVLNTVGITNTWRSYGASSEELSISDYHEWAWEKRWRRAHEYARPINARLYHYANHHSGYVALHPNYNQLSPDYRISYGRLLMWVSRVDDRERH